MLGNKAKKIFGRVKKPTRDRKDYYAADQNRDISSLELLLYYEYPLHSTQFCASLGYEYQDRHQEPKFSKVCMANEAESL